MKREEFLKRLGSNIVKLREERNLRQIDLATKLNIEDSALRRIESGRTNPTVITLKNIAEALEVKINDILTFND